MNCVELIGCRASLTLKKSRQWQLEIGVDVAVDQRRTRCGLRMTIRPRIVMRSPQRVRPLVDCDIHADLELPLGTPMRDFFNVNDARRSMSSTQFMDRMSSETGGGFVFLRDDDDLGVTFTRISNELHYLYLLGFTPQSSTARRTRSP